MGSETTPEMLAMARRIVAKWYRNVDWASESLVNSIEKGALDQCSEVQAALTAIKETTELASKLAEERDGYNDVTGSSIATALRNGEHYHD